MQMIHILAAALIPGTVFAWPTQVRRGVECGFSTSPDSGETCETFSNNWGISVGDLKGLNPGIDCPDLDINNLYCVIGTVTDDPTTPTPIPSTTPNTPIATKPSTISKLLTSAIVTSTSVKPSTHASITKSAVSGVATPQPTQPGMVSNCNTFYYVAEGISCSQMLTFTKISLADLFKWNPTVLADCSGMWAEVNVCVGVIGATTITTSRPSSTTPVGNGIQTPQPTQPGMATNCAKFHYVNTDVTCSQITSYEKISLADFVKWNPTIGSGCTGMQAGVNVCVGLTGTPTTTNKPSTTTSVGNGTKTPQPIQPGMVTNCKKFHYVAGKDTCNQIISYEKITLANFVKWNTGVGSDCRTMWANTNVCVGV
jgi:hypothetical protein